MARGAGFHVEPLEATFGAIVTGLKLASLDDVTFDRLYETWLEYALLIFPDQHLTNTEQAAFARRFGELEFNLAPISNVRKDGTLRPDDGTDDIVKVLKGNMGWHCDSTYMPVQAKGAVFTAHVVTSAGGETGWADMRSAYQALDAGMRERVAKLSAYHSLVYSQAKLGHAPSEGSEYSYGFHGQDPPLRPLVKVHPETGRPSLVIGRHAYGIPGLDPAESERLLQQLLEGACQPPRVYQHTWTPGEAVVWDNRCLLHQARPWDMREPRVMYHSRIAGDPKTEFAAHEGTGSRFPFDLLEDPAELASHGGWAEETYRDLIALQEGALSPEVFDARYRRERGIFVLDLTSFTESAIHGGSRQSFLRILDAQRVCLPVLRDCDAELVRTFADDIVALFSTAASALDAALEIQRRTAVTGWSRPASGTAAECCIGIGYGPTYAIGPNLAMGDEMNRASKLGEDTARGGEILVTEGAREALTGRVDVRFEAQSIDDLSFPYYRVEVQP